MSEDACHIRLFLELIISRIEKKINKKFVYRNYFVFRNGFLRVRKLAFEYLSSS